jgi:HK97 family phage major capsid protein
VAEGGTKPPATLDFVGAKADPTVLATTLVISKQLFEDAAAVVQYINQRLPYLVKFKEDWEFLNGSGTWPDIEGIFNAGPQTQGAVAGEVAITLGEAFAKVELADGAPTFVVLNPNDAWAMFTKRAAGGAGTFDAGTPFSALPLTVWGVPTYRTRAINAGLACVADGERGAMIIDRESVNVQTYRERYAEVNQILLVCEERVGLAIWRPDLFVKTTISA